MDKLINEIFNDLSIELGIPNEDGSMLLSKVKSAYREVKGIRSYPTDYTDDFICSDMERYYYNVKNLALYDYNQIGVEGQSAHGENGTSRTWVDRNKYLERVVAICTLV